MMASHFPIITALILFPLLGCVGLFFITNPRVIRGYALIVSLVELTLGLPLLMFRLDTPGFQFVERVPWVPQWGLEYFVGLDGISVLMVGLTLIILPLCILCSWSSIQERLREFHFCILLLASVCVGVFTALDLVLFFLSWEALLIPMYLIIAVWGGPKRQVASLKFILYTLAGSALLLVAVVGFRIVGNTFSIPELTGQDFPLDFQLWAFVVMALAFAVKVPMFPFHTWLPAAYSQAPTAGSVLLSCVLAKMGAYGFLRFCLPLTPSATQFFAPMMIAMSIASILYGGVVAFGQSDIKKIIAYSSMAHMGFITLGIFLFSMRGFQGAIFQMVSHGITTGGLFVLAGALSERSNSSELAENLGLGKGLPAFMGFWGLMAFAGFAFPGTNNFVGEFLVLTSAFERNLWIGALTVPGALLAAAYMLRPTQRMAWGEPSALKEWKDLRIREWVSLLPLAFLVLYIGLAPTLFFKVMNPTLTHLMAGFKAHEISAEVSPPARPALLTETVVTTQPQGRRGK
jgi:NADH-quinone oxidoreductase subunit M